MMRALLLVAGLVVPLAVQGCDSSPRGFQEEARKRWVERAGVESFDPEGGAPLAGVSALRTIKLEPLDARALDGDTASPEFHRFVHRCSACHQPPAPGQHTRAEWEIVVRRMTQHVDSAGLLPLSALDRQQILRLLSRHAADAGRR